MRDPQGHSRTQISAQLRGNAGRPGKEPPEGVEGAWACTALGVVLPPVGHTGEWMPQRTGQGSQRWGRWVSDAALLHTQHIIKQNLKGSNCVQISQLRPRAKANKLRGHRNTQPPDGKTLNVWHRSKITRQGMQKSNEEGTQSTETNPELTQMLELAGRTIFPSFYYNRIPCV